MTILPSLLASQEQRQQQQSQQPTAIQLHSSLSHKEQHQLTKVPSLTDRLERSWRKPTMLIYSTVGSSCRFTKIYVRIYIYIPGSSKYLKCLWVLLRMRAKTQYTSRLRVTTSTSIHGNALRIMHGLGSFGPQILLLSTEQQSSTHLCTWPIATKDAADSNHSNCHGNACNLHDTTALTPSKIKIDTPPSGRKSCLDSCKDMAVHAMLPPQPEEKERRGLLLSAHMSTSWALISDLSVTDQDNYR